VLAEPRAQRGGVGVRGVLVGYGMGVDEEGGGGTGRGKKEKISGGHESEGRRGKK